MKAAATDRTSRRGGTASSACRAGSVSVNGQPVKPARVLRPGGRVCLITPWGLLGDAGSAAVRRRVVAAREVQLARAGMPNAQLEGAQAGLSWETILKKREAYRLAFDNFAIEAVAALAHLAQSIQRSGLRLIRTGLASAARPITAATAQAQAGRNAHQAQIDVGIALVAGLRPAAEQAHSSLALVEFRVAAAVGAIGGLAQGRVGAVIGYGGEIRGQGAGHGQEHDEEQAGPPARSADGAGIIDPGATRLSETIAAQPPSAAVFSTTTTA